MATGFEIHVSGVEESRAVGFAQACFCELDRLERLLSRYVDGSDVDRINCMERGETLILSEECHACLRLAWEAHRLTAGLAAGAVLYGAGYFAFGFAPAFWAAGTATPAAVADRLLLAEAALEMGFYISLSGMVTFKAADELRDIVRDVPLDRLLVETDAPFLAPMPHRGKTNQPAFVTHTGEYLASMLGVDHMEMAKVTKNNFFRLFARAHQTLRQPVP
jgi:thiamine biosynthesis lipoprotein ApbE